MRVYRLLLRLFPAAFRRRFGGDMAEVFADRRRAARAKGAATVAALWLSTIADVMTHAAAERRLDVKRGGLMSRFVEDLRSAWRSLSRRPAFPLAAMLMLAVGLGFNTALFAVARAVILQPLPYDQPDRIVFVWNGFGNTGQGNVNSYLDYLDLKARTRTLRNVATFNISYATLTEGGLPEQVNGSIVSPEFFAALGVPPLLGRTIQNGDDRITSNRPIVIAWSLWMRRFSGDRAIVGRTIALEGQPRTVVGVMPRTFRHPEPWWKTAEYWSPLVPNDAMKTNRANHFLRIIARLDRTATLAEARAELDTIGRQLMHDYPATNRRPFVALSVYDQLVGDTRPLLFAFLGAVVLVLSLAVANIVNLLLARAGGRRTELAVRSALGAGRGRLASQLLIESVLLGVGGGLLGLGIAFAALRLLLHTSGAGLPRIEDTSVDAVVVAFTFGLSIATGALCGVWPAIRVARARLMQQLAAVRGTSGLEVSRARTWLVAGEMALTMPLLVAAVLLTVTLIRLQTVNVGFDPQHALHFRLSVPATLDRYKSGAARTSFFDQLTARLAALPGATHAGIITTLPLGGLNNTAGTMTFTNDQGALEAVSAGTRWATSGYFSALGIPLKAGRMFQDDEDSTIVINERMARRLWGDASPIGRQLREGGPTDASPWLTVVGVVGDVHHNSLEDAPDPEMFRPYSVNPWTTMSVVVGSAGDPGSLAGGAARIVHDLDPGLPLVDLSSVADVVGHQVAGSRFLVDCAALFSGLGLFLAAFGTFAVLSLLVSQRTREIGIRMALGATPHRVRWLVLVQSLLPALTGCLAGTMAAAWMAGALSTLLFGVEPRNPAVFASALAMLGATALVASWLPARRAMRVDPVQALRTE